MTLTCTLKNGGKKEVYIPIEPPLRGYEDVKPRLLEMKALAQEGLGMVRTTSSDCQIRKYSHSSQKIKAPHITTFDFTRNIFISAVFMSLVAYSAYSPQSASPLFYPANLAQQTIGANILKYISGTIFFLHGLESLYTFHLCRRHHTGLGLGVSS